MKKKKKLGLGFADEIAKVRAQTNRSERYISANWTENLIPNFNPETSELEGKNKWAVTIFLSFVLFAFFIIFLRLFHLQIVLGKQNKELADGNRIQVKVIHAPRGVIYDRNGKVLASNSPGFRVYDPETKKIRILDREHAFEMEVKNDPRAKNLEVDNIRSYALGETTAHIVGFLGEISQDQLKQATYKTHKAGDWIGKEGIEAQYESILKGIDGGEIIEVDSKGNKIRTLRTNAPIPGQNIYLTIDADFQKLVFEKLKEAIQKSGSCCGSALSADPQTGQILALVSFPSYDPNLFTKGEDDGILGEILTDPNSPILDRAIGGSYPPGSTYKIISSIAALESGKVTPQTLVEDTGVVNLGTFSFSNWYFSQYGKTEGPVNLVKALQRSNDTYFYQISRQIGEEALTSWSKSLYLGKKLGIDLPGEVEGLVPSNDWKKQTFGEVWYPGDTLHMSIGQGFLLTTPVQVLGFTSFIAADGILNKPQLILKVTRGNTVTSEFKTKVIASGLVKPDNLKVIKEGLEQVAKNGGTAWPFFTFPISTAGKTGTAEFGHPKNKTHAWYTAYAPSDDPKITMTVLIEAGGEGSTNASPVVKEAFRWFFSPDKTSLLKDVYPVSTESAQQLGE
ncbi:penicillin-binding protein 2 [Candidatus Daviesbacteria bacterium]|nr:penicillin-binding protein 2 [Candidatus Daviesbacteria bacterium]